jgi:hypothetical protein
MSLKQYTKKDKNLGDSKNHRKISKRNKLRNRCKLAKHNTNSILPFQTIKKAINAILTKHMKVLIETMHQVYPPNINNDDDDAIKSKIVHNTVYSSGLKKLNILDSQKSYKLEITKKSVLFIRGLLYNRLNFLLNSVFHFLKGNQKLTPTRNDLKIINTLNRL